MMSDKSYRAMRRAGGWNIVMGITTIVTGLSVGIGCLVAGGSLLRNSRETHWFH